MSKIYINREQIAKKDELDSVAKTVDQNKTDTETKLAKKADSETVEEKLSEKANSEDVDKKLSKKANIDDISKEFENYGKAKTVSVNGGEAVSPNEAGNIDLSIPAPDLSEYDKAADVDQKLKEKADKSETYTKAEIDEKVTAINKAADGKMTTAQVTAELATKANAKDVYTKADVDTKLDSKANTADINSELAGMVKSVNGVKANDSGDVTVSIPPAPDLTPYETTKDIDAKLADKVDKTELETRTKGTAKSITVNGGEKIVADDTGNLAISVAPPDLSPYAKTADVDTKLNGKANSEDVYLKKSVDDKVSALSSSINEVSSKADNAQTVANSAVKTVNGAKPNEAGDVAINIPVTPDLSPYAKTTDVDTKLNGKANSEDVYPKKSVDDKVSALSSSINEVSGKADNAQAIANSAIKTVNGAKPDEKGNVALNIPATPDLSPYDTKTDVDNKLASKVNTADVYPKKDIDDKVNSLNSSIAQANSKADNAQATANGAIKSINGTKPNDKGEATINTTDSITVVTGYDPVNKNVSKETRPSNNAWLVDQAALGGFVDRINNLGSRDLPTGTNLDEFMTAGNWNVHGTEQKIAGLPGNDAWSNVIILNDDGGNGVQIVVGTNNQQVHYRTWNSGKFEPWQQIITNNDLTNLQNTINQKLNINSSLFHSANAGKNWNDILGVGNNGSVLTAFRGEGGQALDNLLGNFSAGVAFGGGDTKGYLEIAYGDHTARIGGGNGEAPNWHEEIAWKSDINNLSGQIANKANTADVNSKLATSDFENRMSKSYFRKQGMNQNGDLVEIKANGTKQADGSYAYDVWSNDWTASKLKDVMGQVAAKANSSDIASLQSTIANLQKTLDNVSSGKADASTVQNQLSKITDQLNQIKSSDVKIVPITQAEYNALKVKDPTTIYAIGG